MEIQIQLPLLKLLPKRDAINFAGVKWGVKPGNCCHCHPAKHVNCSHSGHRPSPDLEHGSSVHSWGSRLTSWDTNHITRRSVSDICRTVCNCCYDSSARCSTGAPARPSGSDQVACCAGGNCASGHGRGPCCSTIPAGIRCTCHTHCPTCHHRGCRGYGT